MSEFCPRCTAPLEFARDPARLCDICGWFGDRTEALNTPPKTNEFNPVLAAAQMLDMYRDVCRKELIAEQIFNSGAAAESDFNKVRIARRQATNALIEFFVAFGNQRGLHQGEGNTDL